MLKKIPRKGTVRLLQLTKDLTPEDQQELLAYISFLEQREDIFFEKLENFVRNFYGYDEVQEMREAVGHPTPIKRIPRMSKDNYGGEYGEDFDILN